jgi:hypothetical protein
MPRHVKRLRRLPPCRLHDARANSDFNLVGAGNRRFRQLRPPPAEAVCGLQHEHPVDADLGNRIEPLDYELHCRIVQHEFARNHPVALRHPAHVILVPSVIGIGDQARGKQRRMDVARQDDLRRMLPAAVDKRPRTGEIDHAGRCRSRDGSDGCGNVHEPRIPYMRVSVCRSNSEVIGRLKPRYTLSPGRNRFEPSTRAESVWPPNDIHTRLSAPIGSSRSTVPG